MPKTRYQHLQDAGDSCDSLVKQLFKAGEEDFAREAQQLLNRLWAAQEEAYNAADAEPELDGDRELETA